jgi:aspartyl/asparaginyl beta-hydroxylase (cupin superfamily)
LQWLRAADAALPGDANVLLAISVVLREQGDGAGEFAVIEAALAADPYFLPGLLAKANHLERHGRPKAAAAIYRSALQVVPHEAQWPSALRSELHHGRELVAQIGKEMAAFLAERVGTRMNALTPSEAERWREAGAILTRQSEAYPSVSARLQVPRLPAIPFFDRADFAWAPVLEARTRHISEELAAVLAADRGEFNPYIAQPSGTPLNQWRELNHSPRWSSYFLWQNGQPVSAHQSRCPVTTQALAEVESADIPGLCPNAMFSALAPHTLIPPHHGETNARLVVHLPLVLPEPCSFRVGFEQRRWRMGEVLIFDDSIEHEARNDSNELRVVLIFDVWNPLLSLAERDMVRALSLATQEFERQVH